MGNVPIYLDSNIYIDYFENRVDKLRPLGEFAFSLLKKVFDCHYKVIVSSLIIDELEFNGYEGEIRMLMSELMEAGKLIYSDLSDADEEKAHNIARNTRTPANDAKHAVIAKRAKAVFFVTRNIRDFTKLQDLVQLRFPENL